ncbi:hypothetical protein MLD38_033405 [Melastoma candidum]|uniref:Uncharacterized protein n=1 Tax=Melastoma candidum TaxID=119954 RepID=A0ACB9M6S2_9MYRT|nr:hypothetical protein MLD38_033405 [Melastoma candidum]
MELRSRRIISSGHSPQDEEVDNEASRNGSGSEAEYIPMSDSDMSADNNDEKHSSKLFGESSLAASSRRRNQQSNDSTEATMAEVKVVGQSDQIEINSNVASKRKRRGRKKRDGPPLLWEIWEDEQEKWIDDNFTDSVDLDDNDVAIDTVDPPADLVVPLLRYQKEWLAWALRQEASENKGGILADEMGMGKTVQAIALVLAKRDIRHRVGRKKASVSSSAGPSTTRARACGTLVICPVVAVTQWVDEIFRFTAEGSTKVLVYHGSNRGKTIDQFEKYDFVVTTYSLVESEYRKHMMLRRIRCPYCKKLFNGDKLLIHLKYFCGPHAVRTYRQSKQEKKKLKSEAWNGELSKKELESLLGDAYNSKESTSDGKSVLHTIMWERIILDEAHYIKDRRCNTAKAILALRSSYKWALSGTPLQNRVGELYSLVRFLQIVPYSYYFCKDCDCRALDHVSSQACRVCSHAPSRHFCWWNRNVSNVLQQHGNTLDGKRAMIYLKHKILRSILLRRTKNGRAADLALPPRIVTLRRDSLDVREEDYYTSLYNESQAQFNTYVQAGTVLNNYAHIFDLLTRLRQAVDHPYLVVYSRAAVSRNETQSNGDTGEQECGLCHDPAEDPVVTSCMHVFCKGCLTDFSASLGQVSCPKCSKPLTVDLTSKADANDESTRSSVQGFRSTSILNRIQLDDFQTSTKIEALREEIRFMVERDGSAKGIVFSQFTSFLDLISYALKKSGICCVQLAGHMSRSARDAAIKKFTEDPECRIFLVSLKAGGVALNLTVASHVFVMDPWWNPAVERQAQDRIHRIGQYKPIRIIRFVIENTVEERILKLQEKKELVFEGTVGGSSEALQKLTEADMRFLFAT